MQMKIIPNFDRKVAFFLSEFIIQMNEREVSHVSSWSVSGIVVKSAVFHSLDEYHILAP